MDNTGQGWFVERSDLWPGRALSLEIERKIVSLRSPYQHIELYETKCCGKMLVLDGIIQFTEADEFTYQEMMAHPALFAHPGPERALVVGGGDGGVLREVARHPTVKEIDLCEIDEAVIRVCKEHVPSMAVGFEDPRVRMHIRDGSEFVREREGTYDVVIVDSTDPIGPAEALFEEPFYAAMKRGLSPTGIIASQAESIFLHGEIVKGILTIAARLFPVWGYAYVLVPTYPGGGIGVCLASLGPEVREPARLPDQRLQRQLRYYTPEVHRASFVLPAFAERMIQDLGGL